MDIKDIRQDFPSLEQKISGRPVVYFDNACMSLRPRQVIEAVRDYYEKYPACGGRSGHSWGNLVTEKVEETRKLAAKFIGARKKEEIVFTKNTTEALNLVANSLELAAGDIVVLSDKEHNSNLVPWQVLKEKKGIELKFVTSREDNSFDLEAYKKLLNKRVKLVSVVYNSNLDGLSNPVAEIIKSAHQNGSLIMLDAAQAAPHREINVKKLDVDFLAFSGHKMLGPSGTGVLYGKLKLLEKLPPFMVGGDTVERTTYDFYISLPVPEKFEAGLQHYAGIIGLGEAIKYLQKIGFAAIKKQEYNLNNFISHELARLDRIKIIGPEEAGERGGICNFTVEHMPFHEVAVMLEQLGGVMVRSGQHCVHSWFDSRGITGSVRASFYFYNTQEEAERFMETLKKILEL